MKGLGFGCVPGWLPWWLSGKESTCNARDTGSIPGWGRSPGGGSGNPLQYSCLENPMDRGAWRPTVHVSQRMRVTEHACLHMPREGVCTLGGVVGSSCQVVEAPLCCPRPRGTRLLWAPSGLTPRAPSRQHLTLCESGQAWAPGKRRPGSLSPETSRRTAKDSQGNPIRGRWRPCRVTLAAAWVGQIAS